MISDVPRQKLCEILTRFGQSVSDDPRKCEGLLRDFCGGHRREIYALVNALRERIAEDLLAASDGVPRELLVARLAKRLEYNRGQDSELARWAVESWGLALGRLSPADLQKEPAKKPKTIPDSKPARVLDPTPIPQQQGPIRQSAPVAKPVPIVQPSPIPEPTPLPHPVPTPEPLPRRNYKLVAGVLVGLTLVGGGSKILWDKWRAAEEARRQAIIQAEAARRKAEEERKQVELRLQQERRQAELRFQQQERERQVLWQQQKQRDWELQQRALWEKQQKQRGLEQRSRQQWEQQRQREWQQRQRQAQIEQQRRQQEWQERQRLEQERRQKEAQERAAQQQRDRLIQEGLRALERLGR